MTRPRVPGDLLGFRYRVSANTTTDCREHPSLTWIFRVHADPEIERLSRTSNVEISQPPLAYHPIGDHLARAITRYTDLAPAGAVVEAVDLAGAGEPHGEGRGEGRLGGGIEEVVEGLVLLLRGRSVSGFTHGRG